MKRIFNIFLAFAILFSVLLTSGCVKDEDLNRNIDGYIVRDKDNGVALMGVEKTHIENNVFVVPQEIKGNPVVSIGYRKKTWVPTDELTAVLPFQANEDIKKIIINHDILVHPYAFADLKVLYEVEVSSSLSISKGILPYGSTFGSYYIRGLTAKVETIDELKAWLWSADELRTLKLQAEQLNRLMLEKPDNLIAYFADGAKSISDSFSKYENLSVFIVPETVTEIENGAFDNCSMDLYFRISEEDCSEIIKSSLPTECNIVWGFEDEIVVFDSLNENDIIFEETQKNYQVVSNGGKIECPNVPIKDGYIFDGWYSDYAYSRKWDFENDIVSDSMTLVAKWIEN